MKTKCKHKFIKAQECYIEVRGRHPWFPEKKDTTAILVLFCENCGLVKEHLVGSICMEAKK